MSERRLFDTKFVHFMWDDTLKGKKCFVADNIGLLKHYVEGTDVSRGLVAESGDNCYPFMFDDDDERAGSLYQFAYYDPNYDVKWAYYKEGKQIQVHLSGPFTRPHWDDCDGEPGWDADCEYRVKPEEEEKSKPKRMTYRQFAEWLAKGNGEYRPNRTSGMSYTASEYRHDLPETEVPEEYEIRYWGCDKWIEPTEREYLVAVKHVNPDMTPAEWHSKETCI